MEDWKKHNQVEWGAPTKEAGRAQYTVWEAMLELEPRDADAAPKEPRVTMFIGLQKSTRNVQLIVVYFDLPVLVLRMLCG